MQNDFNIEKTQTQYLDALKKFSFALFYHFTLDFTLFLYYNSRMKKTSQLKPSYKPLYLIPDKLEIATQIVQNASCRPHNHDFYEIFYMISGNMEHSLNGDNRALSAGDCILLTPNDTHAFFSNSDSMHRDLLISNKLFESTLTLITQEIKRPLELIQNASYPISFTSAEIIELENIAQKFTRENEADKKRCIGVIFLLNILLKLFKNNEYTNPTPKSISEQILDCLNKNTFIQGGVPTLSKQLKYSPSYLCHVFKQQTGIPLSQHIKHLRLTYIAYYLKTTNYSLKKIADLVGIESLPYLNKIFKEKYVLPPIQFRKQYNTSIPEVPTALKKDD